MANWLQFDKLKAWSYLTLPFFQYDAVTDAQISSALADTANLVQVDTALDWEDDFWLARHTGIREADKHAYRVAALVAQMRAGRVMESAICLDTFCNGQCGCCISNGHHRLRALQYLGLSAGPFALSGYLDPLEDLVRQAGCPMPAEAAAFVSKELQATTEEDVWPE